LQYQKFYAEHQVAVLKALSTCWDVKAAVGKSNPNGRDDVTIKRRLLSIFYTGDLIPE